MLIASDGSSLKSIDGVIGKGPIAWAWARDDGHWYTNGYTVGTNQQAELMGLISLLVLHPKEKLHVQLDSKYALNTAEKWIWGWARKNWVKSDGEKVMNLNLIIPLYEILKERKGNIDFEWVKGHDINNKNPLNTKADELANTLSNQIKKELLSAAIDNPYFYRDSKERSINHTEKEFYDRIFIKGRS